MNKTVIFRICKNKSFDSIILDIDGTIWNTTPIVSLAWNKAIQLAGFNLPPVRPELLQKEFGKTMNVIADDLWPSLDAQQKKQLMDLCCRQEQIALNENTCDITYSGVVESVKKLSSSFGIYVVSNCQSGYIELTLKKTGLTPYVKDFECYGRTGKGKKDNLLLLVSRNELKKPVYIGDTQGDCDSCKNAGIPFIWASYGFGQADSYIAKLDSFSDVFDVME